jgi:hypothetical protein
MWLTVTSRWRGPRPRRRCWRPFFVGDSATSSQLRRLGAGLVARLFSRKMLTIRRLIARVVRSLARRSMSPKRAAVIPFSARVSAHVAVSLLFHLHCAANRSQRGPHHAVPAAFLERRPIAINSTRVDRLQTTTLLFMHACCSLLERWRVRPM